MNLAETAKLIIQLDLKGNAVAGIKGVTKALGDLDKAAAGRISGGFKTLGAGLGVAFINASKIAIGAIGGLIGAVGVMAKEGQEAAKSHLLFTNAIQNSGQVSTAYVKILKDQQLALLDLAGVDDELIEAEQTKLIQMGLTGEAVAKLTPLILDLSTATGIDLLTATTAVGKAANGSATSLIRYGIFVDKAKFKTDPLVATMEALSNKFKGATASLSGGLDVKLKVFNERLKNIREEAGIKLLPALTRLVDVAGQKLVPAFGKFVDRILPALEKGINDFADILESGGVERGINAITDAVGPMIEVLKLAVGPVQALVKAFLSLPQKVQAGLISGFLINKLSGGLVAQGGKDIIGGIGSVIGPSIGAAVSAALTKIGFTRGASPFNPLFVSDVQNRAPNGQFAPGFKPTPLAQALKFVGGALLITGVVSVATDIAGLNDPSHKTPDGKTFRGTNLVDVQIGNLQRSIAELAKRAGTDAFAARQMAAAQKELVRLQQLQLAGITNIFEAVEGLPNALGGRLYLGGGRPEKDDPIMPGGKPKAPAASRTTEDRGAYVAVKVTQSIKDVNTAQDIRGRWSPTASQAGAA